MLQDRAGYKLWVCGRTTREQMENANRAEGRPCYCASLGDGYCDFCTDMVQVGSDRWKAGVGQIGQPQHRLSRVRFGSNMSCL